MRTCRFVSFVHRIIGCCFVCIALVAQADRRAGAQEVNQQGRIAPVLAGLGDHHHPVTTKSKEAQQFFDQGLRLSYAFNHAEAIRAFRQAALLDPACAMAYWGHALALGPNINAAMSREAENEAVEVLQKALMLRPKVSQKERDYIDALAKRYSAREDADRSALDKAYADAMRELSKRYPDDFDAATLFAEALMDLTPWDYWKRDGKGHAGTMEIVATLESIISRNPNHPGALHFYIHTVEASKTPERGVEAADRLGKLMPGAGHLVHMPAHIYIRVGRYADSSRANELAIEADDRYITQCRVQGLYPLVYFPHNIHFLWASATLEGRSGTAIQAARQLHERIKEDKLEDPEFGALHLFHAAPLFALTRFGKWDEILSQPAPDKKLRFETGTWHYARGTALAAGRRFDKAATELDKLRGIAAEKILSEYRIFGLNSLGEVLAIAQSTLAGELAAARGNFDEALGHLETAVRLDDGLIYNEPHDWHYPPRQSLGAVLIVADRAAEAETVYWEDLRRNAENGWSLFGLTKALEAQGKSEEAAAMHQRFEKAWAAADVKLTASRF